MQPGEPPGLIYKGYRGIGFGSKREPAEAHRPGPALSRKDITVILYHIFGNVI